MTTSGPQVQAPYGTWTSPWSAADVAGSSLGLSEVRTDGSDIYWLESRAEDAGRTVLVRHTSEGRQDVTAAPFNVRSRVHEYGGGAYAVAASVVVFVDFADQRLHRIDPGDGAPRPITADDGDVRFGGLHLDPRGPAVYAVREDHRGDGEPVNTLVRVDLDGSSGHGTVLVEGPDFVAHPCLSPDGSRLAWIQWDHPNMPWDDTSLCVADIDTSGLLGEPRRIAGGEGESIGEVRWSPDGRLVWSSDRTGYTNLYGLDPNGRVEALHPLEHDVGAPGWSLGTRSFAFRPTADAQADIVCTWLEEGFGRLSELSPGGSLRERSTEATAYASVDTVDGDIVCVAGFADRPSAVVRLRDTGPDVLRSAGRGDGRPSDPAQISRPEAVSWTNEDGLTVHGFFFPPANAQFHGPVGELPPLLVMSHGGPTSMCMPVLTAAHQYWTTRGYAVLEVNYSGSSGYGRAYRERLKGRWGIVDVDDCASGALAMAQQGRVDRDRLAIRGGSAGGFTTLAALTFTDVFAAGASRYGISDLETLVRDTHKFESRYCDGLVGPYPEAAEVYAERSPIHHIDRLSSPMILLQGLDDKVVPPSQAHAMADALEAKGLPVELVVFEGEGHGFRKAENIITALEAEEAFYQKVLLHPRTS